MENYDANLCNTYREVDIVNEDLKKSVYFEKFMDEVRQVTDKDELKRSMGVRLIHKHAAVKEDEIMVEHYGQFQNKNALITYAEKLSEINTKEEKPIPASWVIHEGKYSVFEYTYDTKVKIRTIN